MSALRVLAGVLLLLLAGCGLVPPPPATTSPPAGKSSQVVTGSLKDVERFWGTTFPTISGGKKFQPVRGGFHPYTEMDPPPDCGGRPAEYQPNAFYCPDGDYIAWDAQNLIPQLQSDFGPLLVGVVMAHEYGHAIQFRLGVADQPTVVLEQMADCFAGAWLADVSGAGQSGGLPESNGSMASCRHGWPVSCG
jgi:predicted metalloprotease